MGKGLPFTNHNNKCHGKKSGIYNFSFVAFDTWL